MHGNYHTWSPRMTAELQRQGVWCFCTGNESVPATKPTAEMPPMNATISEHAALTRNFGKAQQIYTDACHRNDQAVRMIMLKLELPQYEDLEGKSVKEVWDTLKARHIGTHTGLAAFWTKKGMLEKKYTDGEDMNAHLMFFTMENRKLGKQAFDDESLVQLMLMSLPHDSTWETLVVVLLQSTSDTVKLKTSDVTAPHAGV